MPDIRMLPQRYEPDVPLDRLVRHPANFNEPDLGLLCQLLDSNGFAGAVLAQAGTGILIDGHSRLEAARDDGLSGLPVIWVDVDDDTRDRLLGEWNYSGRMGRDDETKLLAFLQGLAPTERGLDGTGRTGEDLDDLIARINTELPPGFQEYDESIVDQDAKEITCPACGHVFDPRATRVSD